MTKNLIIVGICILFIGVILALLFRQAPKPQLIGDLTPSQENELRASLAVERVRGDSLQRELDKREDKDSIERQAHRNAVAPHKNVIARLEKDPEVIRVRDSVPKVDSLLKAKDSVIVHHEKRIAEQELSAQVTKEINEQVKDNFEKRLSDTQGLLVDKEAEVVQLQGENKKLRRRLFFTKVAGVVILGGIVALSL